MKRFACLGGLFFASSLSFATSLPFASDLMPHPLVKKRSKYNTGYYLENILDVKALAKTNAMAALNPNQHRYSILGATIHKPAIIRVGKLLAHANYIREIESNPEKYGSKRLTLEHKKARSQYLSEALRIVYKRNYKQIHRYTKRARHDVNRFYEKTQALMAVEGYDYAQTFTREDALTYLKLMEERGELDQKGPTYTKTFARTGATEERYFFTWSDVTMRKLRKTVARDYYHLMEDVKSLANSSIKGEASSVAPIVKDDEPAPLL